MTKEESIKVLTQYIDYDAETPDYYEMEKACKVAIKALEQEPTAKENLVVEDAISRAELLKAVDTWDKFGCDADSKLVPYKDCYVAYIHYDDVVKAIKGMPSVQPKPKTDVLDKIKNEITMLIFFSRENVIDIIDKYTAEKE